MNLAHENFGNKMSARIVDTDTNNAVVGIARRKVKLASTGASTFVREGYTYTAKLADGKTRLGPVKSMALLLERVRQALPVAWQ